MRNISGILTFIICLPLIGTIFIKPDRNNMNRTESDMSVINESFMIQTHEDIGNFLYKPEELTILIMYKLIPDSMEFSSSEDYIAENDEVHDPEQEYLKALAIVCRTNIIYIWEKEKTPEILDFDKMELGMTNFSQIYSYGRYDDYKKVKLNEIKRAVSATKGAVITKDDNVVAAPFFTSKDSDMFISEAGDGVGFSLNYGYKLAMEGDDFYEILKSFYENIKLNIYE